MALLPGAGLALVLAIVGGYLSELIGVKGLGFPGSPVSGVMVAILLGIALSNTISLPAIIQPGITFGVTRILRLGIVLLGIRLSLGEVGAIGRQSLPIIFGTVTAALLIVTYLSRRLGLSRKLGTLIAVGTSVCGATAIIATAPAIGAKHDEVAYSVACVTLFGIAAMLVYPFAAHWMFNAEPMSIGLFLGTSVHETAQVAGAGLVYQQYYSEPRALDVATVTKLVRNLGMLVIIPLMSILYHRNSVAAGAAPRWWTMIPLFVVGFACVSIFRTIGDVGDRPFGLLESEMWQRTIAYTRRAAEFCLTVAMAAVGLGTSIKGLVRIGLKPLGVGLFSALIVGGVSALLIAMLY